MRRENKATGAIVSHICLFWHFLAQRYGHFRGQFCSSSGHAAGPFLLTLKLYALSKKVIFWAGILQMTIFPPTWNFLLAKNYKKKIPSIVINNIVINKYFSSINYIFCYLIFYCVSDGVSEIFCTGIGLQKVFLGACKISLHTHFLIGQVQNATDLISWKVTLRVLLCFERHALWDKSRVRKNNVAGLLQIWLYRDANVFVYKSLQKTEICF